VLQGAKGHFVVLVDKDGKALLRNVEVGPWLGDDWFINAGLQPGDRVVTDGMARLSPGATVTIVELKAASAAPAAAPKAAAPAAPTASK
jgi:membrane fusion protein (multidrug efflux system)